MSEITRPESLFRLDGKVAFVTGGSRGLGFYTATIFLLAGAKKVIISARKAGGLEGIDQAVVKLNALPGIIGKAVGLAGDMSKESEIKILLRKIRDGGDDHIDILIANAGATWGGPFEESPDWATAKVLDLNVRGVFNLVKEALPMLEKRASHSDPSRVIIVSSIANSKVVHTGQNSTIIYSVSKAAATHMARNFAVELGPRNITCNSISPGFFPSKLANGLIENLGGLKHLESMNPRRRLGEPDDIAGAMLYLCSRAGNYINGVDLEVDGGDRLGRGSLRKKDKKNSKL